MNELNTLKLEKCPEEVEAEIASELVTINDVVRYATSYLIENEVFLGHGTDSYWDEAMYLVMCTINLDPPADPDTLNARLTMREKKNIAKVLTKRVKERVPSAYLTNRAWFCDIEFYVDDKEAPVRAYRSGDLVRWDEEGQIEPETKVYNVDPVNNPNIASIISISTTPRRNTTHASHIIETTATYHALR